MPVGSLIGIHSASSMPHEEVEAYMRTEDGRRLRMGTPEYEIYLEALEVANRIKGKNKIYDGTPEFKELENIVRQSRVARKLFPGMGQ